MLQSSQAGTRMRTSSGLRFGRGTLKSQPLGRCHAVTPSRTAAPAAPRREHQPEPASAPAPAAAPAAAAAAGLGRLWERAASGVAAAALSVCLTLAPAALAAEGPAMWAEAAAAASAGATATAAGEGATAAGSSGSSSLLAGKGAKLQSVYFGNGCFWGRQKDFVEVERQKLGRTSPEQLTAVVGYAAGGGEGPGGRVCYVYDVDKRAHYDSLGHAEVTQLGIAPAPGPQQEAELRAFARAYFAQFKKTPFGMSRSDPQDRGAAYRNVIGLPGGIRSPLFHIIEEENVNGMALREGRGNTNVAGGSSAALPEDDVFNAVWVVDSEALPFYRAERYHQFHNGLGKKFPEEYTRQLRSQVAATGLIDPTGCVELPMF
ncbi:hypothetical protein CHLRE_14g609400v5 [Chlamydomonas reinhardtii]|uniref:Peptide-methionine (S)-S-oxide reductase n=1 Tax=Chlamydomonas reinhardtii TaxID=3055 RepID=A0A2K3CX65_CHLRE|nr:uncharacterized protein CHLRE_14g609400v5 [Chlamydomonas reinhardtii]PNW72863.1 hypothetical protein CHLRE_14g609400v5 [Chlamydomonas reinhardtii]